MERGDEDYSQRQEDEVAALKSIFDDDFADIREQDPWKVRKFCGPI